MDETETRASERTKDAIRLIRYHAAAAGAVVLVPIPVVDIAGFTGIQVNLVRSLAKLYDVPFSDEIVRSVVGAVVSMSVPGAVWSVLKFVPIVGLVGSTVAGAASTYALGKVFVQHFESGGTFLTLDPDKVRKRYAKEVLAASEEAAEADDEDYGGIKP